MDNQTARSSDHSAAPSNVDDNRSWMYKERKGKLVTPAWQHGLDIFLDHAFSLPDAAVDGESHCPCTKCFCRHKRKRDAMTTHLCNNGFMLGYEKWTSHGESDTPKIAEHDDGDWRFKCDPSDQENADAALEANFTNKVRQMLHEEKAAAIKRLNKNGDMHMELDEEGNSWPTKEALISAKPPGFGTIVGWRLLCEHWSSATFRKISLTNKKNRLAHGKTVFHTSGARSAVSTRQHLKLKNGQAPGISGAWLHTHNLKRGTDQEKICSQRASERWENFDEAMTNAHGENWEEEHPELDAQIIYDAVGRMPHGRLGIANELFTKTEKSKIKFRRPFVSHPVRSAKEDRLQRENDLLKRDNKRLRGIELVVRSLAEKGGVNYDAMMQSIDMSTSDSEVGCERRQDVDRQHDTEKEMGSNTQGSPSREKNHGTNDDADDTYDNEGEYEGYGYGDFDDDGYGNDYDNEHYDQDGNGRYDNYGDDDLDF